MASTSGLSKKHSPLQKAHYLQYRVENRARKNLIIRLKRHIKNNQRAIAKRVAYNARRRGKGKGPPLPPIHTDNNAINRLKALGA